MSPHSSLRPIYAALLWGLSKWAALARKAARGDDDEDPALAVFFLFVSHQNHIFHANLEDN